MSKKALIVIVVLVLFLGGGALLVPNFGTFMTKRHSPLDEVRFSAGGMDIAVDYCQPYKKEREIFGGIVPFGEVWRTGANDATTFEVNGDILFGGEPLAAGTYALFTIPNENEWTIILNSVDDQWGAFDYDESQDVLRVTATPEALAEPLEQFTIEVTESDGGASLSFAWDATVVRVPITVGE